MFLRLSPHFDLTVYNGSTTAKQSEEAMFKSLSTLPVAFVFVTVAHAGVIIQAVDSGSPNSMQLNLPNSAVTSAAAVSWTQTGSYSNVSVSAYLFGELPVTGGQSEQYTAYLTNNIGAAATAANNVAPPVTNFSQPFSAPAPGTPTLLFSGLTLGPGTYYLVIQSLNTSAGGFLWESKAGLSPVFGSGVSGGAFYLASSDGSTGALNAGFAPGSVFGQPSIGGSVMYSVTGDPGTSTPEPLSLMLSGVGLAAFGLLRRNVKGGSGR